MPTGILFALRHKEILMHRPTSFLPLAATAVLALALATGAQAAAPVIDIGYAGPISGPVTQYGDMVKEGIDTAIERINADGGVLGRQLKLVAVDDGCEPKQGPIAANRMINDHIGFVIGHVCSGATIAAASIYNEEGVLMITPSATTPALTDGKHFETIFRTIGRDDQQGPAAARFIAQHARPAKVAILHDKQSYGHGIAHAVHAGLEKAGVNVVLCEGIGAGDSDYSAIITRLKTAGVDFVYYGGYHPEMGLLMRQAAEQGLKARFMGPEGVGNPDINAIAGDAVEGMLLTLPADFSRAPRNAAIVQAFEAKHRNAAGAFQLSAYAAMQAIATGIAGTRSTDPGVVAHYLHTHEVDTPLGLLSWNAQGDLNEFEFAVFTWHKDGGKSAAL
jgi:branched-chain amino acid transport system substrate-binding protein